MQPRRPRACTRSISTAWAGQELLGCGALKQIDSQHGEIKSMRTQAKHRGQSVAQAMLAHIVAEAQRLGYTKLSLKTGPQAEFAPARRLYKRFGFNYTGPFDGYLPDPCGVIMCKDLRADALITLRGGEVFGNE